MTQGELVLGRCRVLMGDFYRLWTGERVRLFQPGKDSWTIQCGRGRFDPTAGNAARSRRTAIWINFQIVGDRETSTAFEFCVAWPNGWQLLFHHDPARETWPDHPKLHLQLEPPREPLSLPPFSGWRIPLGESQPERILEYLVRQIV